MPSSSLSSSACNPFLIWAARNNQFFFSFSNAVHARLASQYVHARVKHTAWVLSMDDRDWTLPRWEFPEVGFICSYWGFSWTDDPKQKTLCRFHSISLVGLHGMNRVLEGITGKVKVLDSEVHNYIKTWIKFMGNVFFFPPFFFFFSSAADFVVGVLLFQCTYHCWMLA